MDRTLSHNGVGLLSPAAVVPQESSLPRRILLVEDHDLTRRELQRLLQDNPQVQVDATAESEEALRFLSLNDYSLVLTDLRLPGLDGIDFLKEVQRRNLPVTVIVITGDGSIDEAVQALHLGAYDFLTKPIDFEHLSMVVARALRERALRDELTYLRNQLQTSYSFHNILSKNPQMHAIFELISNVAYTTTTVLIEGETGTGKEQTARAIHQASQNRTGPLVAVNCAALPETLLESELFGHEKGAFTSAVTQRRGRFEMADGGTIFLDEVGDVPLTMQAKLLRVLQERRFERVGGTQSIEVDVRVIAATNRNLKRLVAQGTFREDLYYRLNVVKIELPPLRERPEDIPLLATHFIGKSTRPGEAPNRFPRGRWRCCSATAGRATSASWRTPSSGPASLRATTLSRWTTCRRRSRPRRRRGRRSTSTSTGHCRSCCATPSTASSASTSARLSRRRAATSAAAPAFAACRAAASPAKSPNTSSTNPRLSEECRRLS